MSEPEAAPARLRVAVLNRVFSPTGGGAESYSIRVVEQLAARHEIHVFAQHIDHEWPGVTYHRVPRPMAKPRWINQLWYAAWTWWATRRGFDVVHSHENSWHGGVQTIHVKPVRSNLLAGRSGGALAARWLKIALSPRLIANLRLESARFAAKRGRRIALASETLRRQAVEVYPQAAPMMSVITPGVNLPADTPSRAEARRSLGLPEAGALLLFVANDYARKGLDALLAAVVRLPVDAHLVVVGNAADRLRYEERARTLGLALRVHFLGAMKDVGPAYRAATALAHPTLDDTFAMVVLEAMAHGLPVVVSGPAHCGISALLEDGVNALLLDDPRDEGQLAGALSRVLGDAALAELLSANGRLFAEQHTWEEAARRYEELYRLACRGATPPA
ncbi:MAG: glycosyltransferase family 1 protein [Ramlibacter sp.]|nr:glycosyltransferase family 1 protein [Ramlibacter sp.]